MADSNSTRIVLLGNTGSGKSSLANTLFGEDVFPVNSGTKLCLSKTKTINDRSLQLIDTPGFFDTDPRSSELSPELLKCITECAPGPHVFLLVLKVEENTELEQMAVALTLRYFSEEALKLTTVVFTHGDQLQEEKKIEEWVEQNENLRNLVQKCGGRRHVINNKYWNNSQDQYRNNQNQIEELLKTIDQTVRENRGGHYTNELLQEFKSLPNISDNENLSSLENVPIGILLVAFLGAIGGAGSSCCLGAAEEEAPDREEPEPELKETVELGGEQEGLDSGASGAMHNVSDLERLDLKYFVAERPKVDEVVKMRCALLPRLTSIGMAFVAGKAYERYGSPTKVMQDLTKFSKEAEDMFVQMRKTAEAMKGFAGVFSE